MSTVPDFAAFVTEQLGGTANGVTSRKMFGEYGLYYYGKFFAVICDNTLYIKPTRAGEALLAAKGELALAPPYDGAKDHFRIDCLDDCELLSALLEATDNELAVPKLKKKSRVNR